MSGFSPMMERTGVLFKIKPKYHKWTSAKVTSVGADKEGLRLEVQGFSETGVLESCIIYVKDVDAANMIGNWGRLPAVQRVLREDLGITVIFGADQAT